MKIEDLRAMESKATDAPWTRRNMQALATEDGEWMACGPIHSPEEEEIDDEDEADSICEGKAEDDATLLMALRNLAPELIAMWEAGNEAGQAFESLRAANMDADAGIIVTDMESREDAMHKKWVAFAATINALNRKSSAL